MLMTVLTEIRIVRKCINWGLPVYCTVCLEILGKHILNSPIFVAFFIQKMMLYHHEPLYPWFLVVIEPLYLCMLNFIC
jgi:hypothetical protein